MEKIKAQIANLAKTARSFMRGYSIHEDVQELFVPEIGENVLLICSRHGAMGVNMAVFYPDIWSGQEPRLLLSNHNFKRVMAVVRSDFIAKTMETFKRELISGDFRTSLSGLVPTSTFEFDNSAPEGTLPWKTLNKTSSRSSSTSMV